MKTVTIQIGNSDDKLSQKQWAKFVEEVDDVIAQWSLRTHFAGFANPAAAWQNACWVITSPNADRRIKPELVRIARKYKQDSIAWTVGETEFI